MVFWLIQCKLLQIKLCLKVLKQRESVNGQVDQQICKAVFYWRRLSHSLRQPYVPQSRFIHCLLCGREPPSDLTLSSRCYWQTVVHTLDNHLSRETITILQWFVLFVVTLECLINNVTWGFLYVKEANLFYLRNKIVIYEIIR